MHENLCERDHKIIRSNSSRVPVKREYIDGHALQKRLRLHSKLSQLYFSYLVP